MIDIDRLCSDLQACVGKNIYGKPETLDINKLKAGGYHIMCAGLIVAAVKAQGGELYNGSNTIWRKYLTECGSVSDHTSSNKYPKNVNPLKSTQLQKGMVVFKWNAMDTSKYPDGKGDYQHIGVVTSVKPLRIVHASSQAGKVTVDTKIGKFCAWGKVKGWEYKAASVPPMNDIVEEEQKGDETVMSNKIIMKVNLNLRKAKSTTSVRLLTIPEGSVVEYTGDIKKDSWLAVIYNTVKGYVRNLPEYVEQVEQPDEEQNEPTEFEEYDAPVDYGNLSLEERVGILEESLSALWARVERMS